MHMILQRLKYDEYDSFVSKSDTYDFLTFWDVMHMILLCLKYGAYDFLPYWSMMHMILLCLKYDAYDFLPYWSMTHMILSHFEVWYIRFSHNFEV